MYFDPYCFSKEGIEEFIKERSQLYLELAKRFPQILSVNIFHDNTDPASETYVRNKKKRFEFYGITPMETDNSDFFNDVCCIDEPTTPSFIQLPHGGYELSIDNDCEGMASKDVVSQTLNKGTYYTTEQTLWPCTAKGIYEHLEWALKRDFIEEKPHVVIVGRSDLVGKPLARLLLANDYTVSVMHSKTSEFSKQMILNSADVIVSATGNRGWMGDLESKLGTIPVYDVGINFEDGHLCGDIINPTDWCTPVPFGCGRLTVEALCWNIIDWYYRNLK